MGSEAAEVEQALLLAQLVAQPGDTRGAHGILGEDEQRDPAGRDAEVLDDPPS